MPWRRIPLIEGEVYHIFNRGIDHRPTFLNTKEFKRGIEVLSYYRFLKPPVRLSLLLIWSSKEKREKLISELEERGEKLIDIFSYCFMTNHFHFLLRQRTRDGIAKFMSNFQNSYTRYFNTKHKRVGALFLDQFKAVRIETDEQLLHVSRYIHLNPYSSFTIRSLEELKDYPWSSLPEFLDLKGKSRLCQNNEILSHFRSRKNFERFIFDQADYQRDLEKIKHLIFE